MHAGIMTVPSAVKALKMETAIINQQSIGSAIHAKKGGMTMDPKQIMRQAIQFNKTAFDNTFAAMTVLQEQTERMITKFMDQAPLLPEAGKDAINEWLKAYKEGCEDCKKAVDESYKKLEEFFAGHDSKGGKSA